MPLLHRLQHYRYLFVSALAVIGCGLAVGCHPTVRPVIFGWGISLVDQAFWVQLLAMKPVWGVVIFLVAHTIAAICGLPGTFLVVIGGIVFGLVWGTIWSVIGATLGAIAAFCVARYCFRQWVTQRFEHHVALQTLNQLVQQNEWSCVLAIRFTPISPFSVVNFLFGLTGVSFKPYAIGTLVGIIPGTLAYTWLGVAGQNAWTGNGMMPLMIALVALAGLSAMPLLIKRRSPLR